MPCFSNRTRTYADKIKLRKITGRQWEVGKGPISASLMSGRQQCLRSPTQTMGGEVCAAIT